MSGSGMIDGRRALAGAAVLDLAQDHIVRQALRDERAAAARFIDAKIAECRAIEAKRPGTVSDLDTLCHRLKGIGDSLLGGLHA